MWSAWKTKMEHDVRATWSVVFYSCIYFFRRYLLEFFEGKLQTFVEIIVVVPTARLNNLRIKELKISNKDLRISFGWTLWVFMMIWRSVRQVQTLKLYFSKTSFQQVRVWFVGKVSARCNNIVMPASHEPHQCPHANRPVLISDRSIYFKLSIYYHIIYTRNNMRRKIKDLCEYVIKIKYISITNRFI